LEQVPAGKAAPLFAHTPPEQLPLPFMIPAKAEVGRTTELKATTPLQKSSFQNPPYCAQNEPARDYSVIQAAREVSAVD
jgi:hypothetical protein